MSKPGPKKGSTHSGMFQKGHDSRRMTTATFRNGQVFRDLCRERTPEMLDMITEFARDDKESTGMRFKAGKYIIEQGYGKPTTPIAISDDGGNIEKLRGSALDARIAQALQHMEKDVMGEVIEGEPIPTSHESPSVVLSETLDDSQ